MKKTSPEIVSFQEKKKHPNRIVISLNVNKMKFTKISFK